MAHRTTLRNLALVAALAALPATAQLRIGLIVDGPVGLSGSENMREFKKETERILSLERATLEWRDARKPLGDESFDRLAVIKLRGSCSAGAAESPRPGNELGLTHVSDGRILPFIEIHCERVIGILAPRLGRGNPRLDQGIVGRALARVAAHEIYHVLANSSSHDESGLAKAALSMNDLYGCDAGFSARSMRAIEEGLYGGRRPTLTMAAARAD